MAALSAALLCEEILESTINHPHEAVRKDGSEQPDISIGQVTTQHVGWSSCPLAARSSGSNKWVFFDVRKSQGYLFDPDVRGGISMFLLATQSNPESRYKMTHCLKQALGLCIRAPSIARIRSCAVS